MRKKKITQVFERALINKLLFIMYYKINNE